MTSDTKTPNKTPFFMWRRGFTVTLRRLGVSPGAEMAVLTELLSFWSEERPEMYPAETTLSALTGYNCRQIRRAQRGLVTLGVLEKVAPRPGAYRPTKRFTPGPELLAALRGEAPAEEAAARPAADAEAEETRREFEAQDRLEDLLIARGFDTLDTRRVAAALEKHNHDVEAALAELVGKAA